MRRRELAERVADAPAQLLVGERAPRVEAEPARRNPRFVVGVLAGDGLVELHLFRAPAPQVIDREVGNNSVEPGKKLRISLKAREVTVSLEESVLTDVPSLVRVMHHSQGDRVCLALVSF